ncbi:unnamed protein product, partial [marine sediment metagenome]
GILTDVELAELRYSGRSAAALRGFKAIYSGIIFNSIVMGWVMLAMLKIMLAVFGWPKEIAIIVAVVIAGSYAILSGLWGVVMTDFIQFIVAMFGSIMLACIAVSKVGGMAALTTKVTELHGPQVLNFFPDRGSVWMPPFLFFVYMGIQWWAAHNVDGGGPGMPIGRPTGCL